jgi:hypothetical protein
MSEYYGLENEIGKPLNPETDYDTCYPVIENGIVVDIVCSEFDCVKFGRRWVTEDGNTARYLEDEEEVVQGIVSLREDIEISDERARELGYIYE